jgi:hypothetical protein
MMRSRLSSDISERMRLARAGGSADRMRAASQLLEVERLDRGLRIQARDPADHRIGFRLRHAPSVIDSEGPRLSHKPMLRLRTHACDLPGLLLALLALGWGGALLADLGVAQPSPAWRWPVLALLFVLVLGFAFSAVPVMVLLVTGVQGRVGGPLAFLASPRWQRGIVFSLWALMGLGTAIAIPAAILLGGFEEFGIGIGHGDSQGTLVAKPGMTSAEIQRGSTLKVNDGGLAEPPVLADDIVFDFVVAGTAIRLPKCRYYYMSTYTHDRKHVRGHLDRRFLRQAHARATCTGRCATARAPRRRRLAHRPRGLPRRGRPATARRPRARPRGLAVAEGRHGAGHRRQAHGRSRRRRGRGQRRRVDPGGLAVGAVRLSGHRPLRVRRADAAGAMPR